MVELKEGEKAPVFSANIQGGKRISLTDYLGKKVILYFYPKDDTPGCTTESCNFRDNYQSLKSKGFEVIGVSADSDKKHQKFIEKYSLPFDLVTDEEHELLNLYGVWGPKKFMGREYDGIHRTTFVISEEGVIEHIIKKVDNKNATGQILELMKK